MENVYLTVIVYLVYLEMELVTSILDATLLLANLTKVTVILILTATALLLNYKTMFVTMSVIMRPVTSIMTHASLILDVMYVTLAY